MGIAVAPRDRLFQAMVFKIVGGKIVAIEVLADPAPLRWLDLAVLKG